MQGEWDKHTLNLQIYGASQGETPRIIKGKDVDFESSNEILVPDMVDFAESKSIKGENLLGSHIDASYPIYDFSPIEKNQNPKIIKT